MTEKLSELLRSQNTIPLSDTTKGDKADKEIVDRLKMELQKFKQDTKGSNDSLSSAVKELEGKMKTANKYLPPLVKSTRHQLLHKNNKVLIYAPACMWKTICGWHYYSANYTFEEGEDSKVSCAKCQLSAQQQGGQVCWQLADLFKAQDRMSDQWTGVSTRHKSSANKTNAVEGWAGWKLSDTDTKWCLLNKPCTSPKFILNPPQIDLKPSLNKAWTNSETNLK